MTAILEERLDKLEKWVAIGIATKDELGALTQRVTLLDRLSETAVNLIPGYFEHDNRITLLEARIDEIIVEFFTLRKMYGPDEAAAPPPILRVGGYFCCCCAGPQELD